MAVGRLRFIRLLLFLSGYFDEEVEELSILRVNALTVFDYVTAEHFPVSFWTFFHGILLSETSHRTVARPLERRIYLRSRRRPDRMTS